MLTLQGQHASRAQSAAFRLDRHTPLIGRTRGNATEDSACIRASSGVSYPVRRIPGDDRTARPGHRCRDWREKAPSGRTGRRADAGQPTCLRVGGSGSDMQAAPQRDTETESERVRERERKRERERQSLEYVLEYLRSSNWQGSDRHNSFFAKHLCFLRYCALPPELAFFTALLLRYPSPLGIGRPLLVGVGGCF